jgi:hypothetical protein
MWKWVLVGLALLGATPAMAGESLTYGAPAAWIRPQAFDRVQRGETSDAARLALQDFQIRIGAAGEETYTHTVIELRTPQALALANLALSWDPTTDDLIVHAIRLHRGDRMIDIVARGDVFTILRRESRLEAAMLDGRLTATLQVEGVEVGDYLEVAYSLRHKDPVMQGRGESMISVNRGKIGHLYLRKVWTDDRPVRWSGDGVFSAPKVTRKGGETELIVDLMDVETPAAPPVAAPPRFASPGRLSATEFRDWGEIAEIMAPMYDQAARLAPDSPLRAEVARIAAASNDPKVRATAALRLVEDQVRYLYLGMNLGGYTPASADSTWTRRFGDCKGKSVLLAALLRELGVEADVVFVSTVVGDGLDAQLPLVEVFDHAIVRARIDGKTYWLDGTRQGDRNLDRLLPPAWRWALPVRPGATLEPIVATPPALPMIESTIELDARAGLDAPAPIKAEILMRGDLAIVTARALETLSEEKLDETLKALWSEMPWSLEPITVGWSADEATGDVRLTMEGAAAINWTAERGARPRRWLLSPMTVGWRADLKREPGPQSEAPYATQWPTFVQDRVSVRLPLDGTGFRFTGGDVAQTVAGHELRRTMTLSGGVFTGVASRRAVVTEFPYADKQAAETGLSALSTSIYLEAPRGYKRTPAELEIEAARTGTTFFEYASRADALFELGRVDKAIATLDAGIARDKDLASAYNVRCWLLGRANRDLPRAMADCEKALTLRPDTASYLDSRALVYFRMGQFDRAIADYDAALERSPELSPSLFMRGVAKRRLGRTEEGDEDIDTATALDPDVAEAFAKFGVAP